jgi:hypothetical protein
LHDVDLIIPPMIYRAMDQRQQILETSLKAIFVQRRADVGNSLYTVPPPITRFCAYTRVYMCRRAGLRGLTPHPPPSGRAGTSISQLGAIHKRLLAIVMLRTQLRTPLIGMPSPSQHLASPFTRCALLTTIAPGIGVRTILQDVLRLFI